MHIKNTLLENYGNFQLDMDKIGSYSTSKDKIFLPYNGPLPAELSNATSATISVTLQVGLTINVLLIVERGGKKHRYPVKATPEEIDRILQPLFFDKDGHTRWDTGLDRYNLGLWQGSYINWHRLVLEEHGLDNLLFQLPPAAIEKVLQHIKHSEMV